MTMAKTPVLLPVNSLESHPLSDQIFGPMPDEEFEQLVQDIDERDLQHPLEADAFQRIICGSQRLRAVKRLKWDVVPVVVHTQLTDENAIHEWLIRDNTMRRQLTPSQMYRAARELERIYSIRARQRQGIRPDADAETVAAVTAGGTERGSAEELAAKQLHTSKNTYHRLKVVYESDHEDLKDRCEKGLLSVSRAAAEVRSRSRIMAKPMPDDDARSHAIRFAKFRVQMEKTVAWVRNNPPERFGPYEADAKGELAKLRATLEEVDDGETH